MNLQPTWTYEVRACLTNRTSYLIGRTDNHYQALCLADNVAAALNLDGNPTQTQVQVWNKQEERIYRAALNTTFPR